MTYNEAVETAVLGKDLFPKTTDAQVANLRDLVVSFPDPKYVRDLLKRLATETTILPTPMVKAELQAELRRRGQTSEAYAKQQERVAEAEAVRQRELVDAFCADFSDEELEELKPKAMEVLRQKLTADAIAFVVKLHPRRSVLLRTAIFKALKPAAA